MYKLTSRKCQWMVGAVEGILVPETTTSEQYHCFRLNKTFLSSKKLKDYPAVTTMHNKVRRYDFSKSFKK